MTQNLFAPANLWLCAAHRAKAARGFGQASNGVNRGGLLRGLQALPWAGWYCARVVPDSNQPRYRPKEHAAAWHWGTNQYYEHSFRSLLLPAGLLGRSPRLPGVARAIHR